VGSDSYFLSLRAGGTRAVPFDRDVPGTEIFILGELGFMNLRTLTTGFCLVVSSVFMALAQQPPAPAPQTAPAQAAPAPAADPVKGDPVVARVQGEPITEKDVLNVINQIAAGQQATPEQQQKKNVVFYKNALDSLVSQLLLKHEGQEKKLSVDQAKADEYFKTLIARFPSEQQFRQALASQGTNETEVRRSIRDSLLLQQVIDETTKDVPAVSDDQIKKFYDENPKFFEEPEQVHAAHILLRSDAQATPEKKEEARKKLEALRGDIESNKISFADAARQNSEDKGSAPTGGDLGFFARGQMVKPFEAAAFNTQPGALSAVFETQFGFHLVKVIEKKPAGKKALEATKADISNFLDRKAKEETLQKHIADLKSKAPIEIVMTEDEWTRRNSK
jgi:peptidyl-prolyl cis-trans isomerase C